MDVKLSFNDFPKIFVLFIEKIFLKLISTTLLGVVQVTDLYHLVGCGTGYWSVPPCWVWYRLLICTTLLGVVQVTDLYHLVGCGTGYWSVPPCWAWYRLLICTTLLGVVQVAAINLDLLRLFRFTMGRFPGALNWVLCTLFLTSNPVTIVTIASPN